MWPYHSDDDDNKLYKPAYIQVAEGGTISWQGQRRAPLGQVQKVVKLFNFVTRHDQSL